VTNRIPVGRLQRNDAEDDTEAAKERGKLSDQEPFTKLGSSDAHTTSVPVNLFELLWNSTDWGGDPLTGPRF
jgi:hypothetical protein